jgi:cystathionine beta-lyase/cystathionine gamma-synthase
VVPPIVLSTTFKQHEPTSFNQLSSTDEEGYEYGRCGNPSRSVLVNRNFLNILDHNTK